ncbi:ATP-binding protein [Thermodesulforhabdus norvegica]|uniref:MinD superfamily P-loop ATPase, contains an inserted ferredoxin domain n=1 Tax=Thermodesulforhabdus norvegica TaxID=39841 RepID=A0A1I4VSS8_9BACT|nr:ATP-binding protein [Thermodesulforhabdus norvegica]SFN04220.1 MinD superfamily P-loop ATPase, contains an inserted ferredoxin domain [Thermodesulforhabdus norvegica]
MILAVASGKGGTGKTTLAVNIARVIEEPVQLLDCDVEEPNVHLFLPPHGSHTEEISISIPEPREELCNGCGECSEFCQFNALVVLNKVPLVFPELCHSCGGCLVLCPQKALREVPRPIGIVETWRQDSITVIQGRLNVGVAMSPPLIRAVKARMKPGMTTVLDAPPGTSCPVITTVRGADVSLLVTEPTPFGFHDLKLAVGMVRKLGVPFGVVINRSDIGDDRVVKFCEEEGIPVLGEIPEDRRIAEAYSRGDILVDVLPEYRPLFKEIAVKIRDIGGVGNAYL